VYYFEPMMPFWDRFISADTDWLTSREGRNLIAKTIRLCRNRYGREEGKRFWHGLICAGVIYPQLLNIKL